jgi:membrane-associated phospholipid phosphatase
LNTIVDPKVRPSWLAWTAVPLVGLALALWLQQQPPQRELFIALNQLAAGLPTGLWEICELLGHTPIIMVLLSPLLLRYPQAMVSVLASIPVGGLASFLLKRLFDSPRPALVLDVAQFHQIGPLLHAYSFPSGHSISAFAAAFAVLVSLVPAPTTRRQMLLVALAAGLAAIVSFSRVAVGAHWPVDVLAGASLGWLAGISGAWITRQYPALLQTLRHQRMLGLALGSLGLWGAWQPINNTSGAAFVWMVAGCGVLTVTVQFMVMQRQRQPIVT